MVLVFQREHLWVPLDADAEGHVGMPNGFDGSIGGAPSEA